MDLREFHRILRQALFVPVSLLLLLAGFFLWQLGRSTLVLRAIDHSDRITSQITDLQRLILEEETGMRGYMLTDDPRMLGPFTAETVAVRSDFADLRVKLAGDDAQEQQLALLSDRYQVWLVRAENMIGKDPALVQAPQINQQNKTMMDSIREVVNNMLLGQQERRKIISGLSPNIEHLQFVSVLATSLLIGLIVAQFTRQRLHTVSRSYNASLEALEQSSREAHENRQWFQTTLESIGDAVIACDVLGRVEFLNAVAGGLTGWSSADALGQPLTEVFQILHEGTREPAENPVEKVIRLRRVVGMANHTVLISRQGGEYVIDDSAAPILDANGEMTGVVLVFRDVTEQRHAEAALIAGEKLAVAGRLAASIAHEIHNPLDSVANLLFLLRDEQDPAKRTEYLQMAQLELGRTMQISRAMLSLYRESKAPIAVDLKELIEGVLLLLERRIAQQQIQVKCEFRELCKVEGFPAELRQVVTNVLVNAIDAAGPKGKVRICVESAPPEEFRGAGALLEVADSGPGITEKDSERLFQPFFTTKGEQGTGLGLWVSMGIVQKHGGMIRLQNCNHEEYTGACARIYLPAKTLANAESRTTAHLG